MSGQALKSMTKTSAAASQSHDHVSSDTAQEQVETQNDEVNDTLTEPHDGGKEFEGEDIHQKRKTMLGQLVTHDKSDSAEMVAFKQRKLDEYSVAGRLVKNQMLSEWIANDSKLKNWYSQVNKVRDEQQVWKEHQKEGWMKPKQIAELNHLDPLDTGDKERLDYLLEQLDCRPCPTFGAKFGDKEYYYKHASQVVDYENNISSGSKAVTSADIKGKVGLHDQGARGSWW